MDSERLKAAKKPAALLAAGAVAGAVAAGALSANAATSPSPSPSYGASLYGPRGASNDTAVTGTAADNVKAAVKAKYPNVTVTSVRKDPDGSYDALGTDANGNPVFYDVSANLKTITANAGHGAHGAMPAPGTAAPTG